MKVKVRARRTSADLRTDDRYSWVALTAGRHPKLIAEGCEDYPTPKLALAAAVEACDAMVEFFNEGLPFEEAGPH